MSHISSVEIEIRDIESLAKACEALGLEFRCGQKTYRWYGKFMADYAKDDAAFRHGFEPAEYGKSEHAIVVPGAGYDIGVCRNKEGKLGLVYDHWGPGAKIVKRLGKGLDALRQRYTAEVAIKDRRRHGYRVQEKRLADGTLRLICTK